MPGGYKVCLFLDGLDEFDGDPSEIAAFLTRLLAQQNNVKLCIASRELNPFKDSFRKKAQLILKVHDLTCKDMEIYVADMLDGRIADDQVEEVMLCEPTTQLDASEKRHFVQAIVSESQGVFLWTTLVAKSIRLGISNGDSVHQLSER